jgi:mono/diheme cytochrome c family protein
MIRSAISFSAWVLFLAPAVCSLAEGQPTVSLPANVQSVVNQHCVSCHDAEVKKGGLDLEQVSRDGLTQHAREWEQVIRKLRARQMPPAGKDRPTEKAYDSAVASLATSLDRVAARSPNPGRVETFRRLNRTEYQNAIRDLLALDIDAAALLPRDDASHGFDNVTVGDLSPTLLNRYVSAAEKISRMAIGAPRRGPGGDTFRLPPDRTQEEHVEGLPPGTRGGTLVNYTFPRDGEYEIQIRLTRDRNEHVEGLREPHELEVLLDRERAKLLIVTPPKGNDHDQVDAHLKVRVPVTAGPHQVGVTFVKNPSSLLENRRQPYLARYNMHRHPRLTPAIYQVSINGPYQSSGPGDTPSRRRIFVSYPTDPKKPSVDDCAEKILTSLMRRAYRRPVNATDLQKPMAFFRQAGASDGFEAGIEAALSAVLVNPEFLFRIEQDPTGVASNTVYRVSDLALASRLSFFLWSSIPDDELLDAAERGELHKPRTLERQARRMLADARATNLVRNFGEQWLHLRNLESIAPDLRLFPEFDDNLRQAFRRETELHFETVLREDRSVLDLLQADYTFLNERLAKHYGVPHVYGSHFRRVALDPESERGGLLRQASVLTVTSYATRTSPVLRGKWILDNIIGTPPPPPLPDVPALDNVIAANLSVRERLAQHRANAACASCHNLMDPPGFALENYDAVGRWRILEEGKPVDASGGLPDGSKFDGVRGLERGLLLRPDLFVGTLTEKLLTFALGRGVEPFDGPAVRQIVREAKADNYRFSSIIVGITESTPFTMRKTP